MHSSTQVHLKIHVDIMYIIIYIYIYIFLYLFMCFSHVAVYTEAWPQNVHDIGEIDYRLC